MTFEPYPPASALIQAAYGGISAESNATATTISGSDTGFGANKVQVVTFGTDDPASLNVTPDYTEGHILVDTAGDYLASISMSIAGTAGDVISFAVFKNNGTIQMGSRQTVTLTGNVDQVSLDSGPMPFVATDTGEIWMQNETAGRNVTMQDAAFHMHRMGGHSPSLQYIPITIYRTLNTIYLESLDGSKYVNWEYGGEVNHDWVLNPVDGKYQSAIWVGDAAGKIAIDGLLYDPPAYPSLAKPSTYDNELTATPATFAAQLAVAEGATGSVRILMGDGTYRDGDLTIAKSGLTLEAENPGSAICTDEWTGALVWSLVSGNVYKTASIQPADPKQVYATISSLSERLSGGEPVTGAEWNAATLNAAAGMGGWYVAAGELHVKLPDDSDPTGKIILSGENDFEDFAEFTGDNVWVDGLIFEFFGKVISPTTTWYDQNESSALRFTASINVGVTNCTFRYLRKHAINCEGCVDVLVETNSFLDNQNEMTYHQIRNSGLGTPGISHLASARALYSRCEDVNHLGNVHDFNLSAAYVAGGRGVDVMNNTFTRARNVPVVVADGRVAVGGAIDDIGWGVTVANNSYDRVGWSVPNNENNAETGIAYWINNWVEECAWPGNNYDGGTIGSFNMHRYGGADSGIFLGLQMIYENIYVSTQKDASFTAYRNWYNQNKNLHAGSRMWNNVISSPDDTGVDATIWSHLSTGDPNVPTSLLQIEFDWNQYYMDGEENAFRQIAKVTLATMQTDHPTFEPNGTYSDPQITGTTIGNRSPTRFIKGVSGNSVLGL